MYGDRFYMPVYGNMPTSELVQIVNPYLAFLRIDLFLANNPQFKPGYYIWNGDLNNGFNVDLLAQDNNRVVVANPTTLVSPQTELYIPPLQSFFVAKVTPTAPLTSVAMSPNWTTTQAPAANILRAEQVKSGGVLNIKATQGSRESYAAIVYTPYSNPGVDKDDFPAIIFNDIPLTVYTIVSNRAMSVNSNGYFDLATQQAIPLGIRTKDAGNIKLEFSGLSTFGHDVYLKDHVLNKEILLNTTPEYSFNATAQGSPVEINDRFTFRMKYTGKGIVLGVDEDAATRQAIQIRAYDGKIYITTDAPAIESISVYNSIGGMIYETFNLNTNHAAVPVPVVPQLYIVKVRTATDDATDKIFVK
jgi:hypothetical protein